MTGDGAVIARPKRQFHWQGLHVPFIAPWSAEQHLPSTIVRRTGVGGTGIGYADELSHVDRRRSVLWTRQAVARGSGTPFLAGVHPLRQRQAMSHMLCQVCGQSTFDSAFRQWGERHLFVARAPKSKPLGEGEVTTTPPICLPCARESVGACPHLRKGWAAALVELAQPWGVAGIRYDEKTLRTLPLPRTGLHLAQLGHLEERWTLASRDVVTLHGVIPIDLGAVA
ncbi:hypothetical protein [Streptomyces sp. 2R]|uniref:hypothetical protein n=1 Tax=Streptomyces sp. 2R TaxID=1883452 RepID=UPI000B91946F|nr:hypothetical protein [Streptomyces sp. 2R]